MTRAALAALLLLAAVHGAAQDTPDRLAQRLALAQTLLEARSLIDSGNPRAAIAKLEALEPSDDLHVGLLLGVAQYRDDQFLPAIERLEPLTAAFPDGSVERREVIQVLGLCRYLSGQLREAIPLLEKTREWAGDSLELNHLLAMAYIQTQQPAQARASVARIFQLPEESAAAHLVTAQLMIRADLDDPAETELRQAMAKDKHLPHARFLLGQTALFRGRVDEALALLQGELLVNPGDAMTHYRLGDTFIHRLEWDRAVESLQRSIWLNPFFSGPYILLGRAYMQKGELATAEGMLRQAIAYDPNNKVAHYMLGQLLQRLGRPEEALRELELADRLKHSPGR
jgi:tetratricopeptide (TPR) repeat protein